MLVLYIGLAPATAITTIQPSIDRVLSGLKAKNTAMGLRNDMSLAERLKLPASVTVAFSAATTHEERP